MTKINVDLQRERDQCTFNVQELTWIIDGGPEKTRQRKEIEQLFLSDKRIWDNVPSEYLSHQQTYENSIRQSVLTFVILRKMQDNNLSLHSYRDLVSSLVSVGTFRDGTPMALQFIMFTPAILNMADEEQIAHWLPRAWSCSIIGSYAQTELGHGTFIRGLETTATYDPATEEFVLHSPTLTAYKWWPGGLGQTANYCIVVAQLYTKGQCHGIHSFMVQLRDEETHVPLPGIIVGDIGPKLGLNGVNNGYLGLDKVRIPRSHMFMKHAKVLEDGTYVKSKHSKLNYGAMVFVRVLIALDMAKYLAKAVTIAVRYSAVRRQGPMKPEEPECQILDYVSQQHKLFITIASCHAMRLTSETLWETFHEINEQLTEGNLERLPELHALSCCLKAVCTSDSAAAAERCRLACGGHGYMMSSNLPLMYGQITAACTYEGENTVLLLQTARFLAKTWQQLDSTNLTPTVAYLKSSSAPGYGARWENTVDGIIRGAEIVAMRKISSAVNNMQKRVAAGLGLEDAWNMTSVQFIAAAEAHCRVIMLTTYAEKTKQLASSTSPALAVVLEQLSQLYAVSWALEHIGDLLRYTSISKKALDELQAWYEELLLKIRPNAVGLVDAFDFCDEGLQSTLGSYDGRVYERLMEEALKSPLNAQPVNDSFHKYLKPFMQGKL